MFDFGSTVGAFIYYIQYAVILQKRKGFRMSMIMKKCIYEHVNQLKFAEIVYRLTQAARNSGSEGIPNDELSKLSNKILQTLQPRVNPLKIESEVYLLVEHLKYFHDVQLPFEIPTQWEHYHDTSETKILIKRRSSMETSASKIVTSYDALYLALQISLAKKITVMLSIIISTQQIKSSDSLCLHVKKAVLVLQTAFSGSPCLIEELMNVADAGDNIVRAPYEVDESRADYTSASACLYNLGGTTSFMLSTIQCLHWVPELKSALIKWRPLFEASCDHLLTAAMRDLFKKLDENVGCVEPRKFLQLFRAKFPKSSQLDDFNNRQDAKECWMQLLDTLSQSMKSSGFSSENLDIVKDLFEIKLISRCPTYREGKSVGMLTWRISNKEYFIYEGLRNYLESEIGEASPFSICGLPRYLTIEFLYDGRNASYVIDILSVDVYTLCCDELQQKLEPARKVASLRKEKRPGLKYQDVKMSDAAVEAQLTGVYDLFTVLAHSKTPQHKGIVSAGHFHAIVKYPKTEWLAYRDEHRFVQPTKYLKGQMRSGGKGERAAFICLYKARSVPVNKSLDISELC